MPRSCNPPPCCHVCHAYGKTGGVVTWAGIDCFDFSPDWEDAMVTELYLQQRQAGPAAGPAGERRHDSGVWVWLSLARPEWHAQPGPSTAAFQLQHADGQGHCPNQHPGQLPNVHRGLPRAHVVPGSALKVAVGVVTASRRRPAPLTR